ncbi:MAG: NAD(P)/FAD-dependent oxidoreductase [Myxococcaceae bacterium]|jgi:cation diffusion facilitator CzcD-associated flavoprotein CzcO|nr:NAD(P)/FAD-dependent oxidoreductase [Myxococcaceae bacterium]
MHEVEVVIIGSGFGGLGAGVRLRERGRTDFVILERASAVGGVWRDNTYPGCACDVRVHLYSFSFFANPDWSHTYARQPEILAYLERVVTTFGLGPHLKFGHEVVDAVWDEAQARWLVTCANGARFRARFVIAALGGLSRPATPRLEGLERFQGPTFHSAQWRPDVPLAGRRVGVIGTGASAIQFVPRLVEQAAEVHLFQRTPAWILPRNDRPIGPLAQRLFRALPFLQLLLRWGLYWLHEARVPAFTKATWLMTLAARLARKHLEAQVPDARLRQKLTPDYTLGCKRVLVSDDFYPAVARPNCHVVTQPIAAVTERGVRTADGREHPCDVLVFGTGFVVTDVVGPLRVVGRQGVTLSDAWRDGAKAWFGTAVHGFPNFFMLTGPNTGLGHSSMVFMIEAQLTFVLKALEAVSSTGARWWQVRDDAEARFNDGLQRRLRTTVWLSGCQSWYLDERGKNVTLWPGFTFTFRAGLSRFDRTHHHLEGVST